MPLGVKEENPGDPAGIDASRRCAPSCDSGEPDPSPGAGDVAEAATPAAAEAARRHPVASGRISAGRCRRYNRHRVVDRRIRRASLGALGGTGLRAFRDVVAATPVAVVGDTDSNHTLRVEDSARQRGSHAPLPKDSIAARRAAASHARRHGADSIKAHSAPPESATPP